MDDARARERLERLNDAHYLSFNRDRISSIEQFGAGLGGPCPLVEVGSNRGRFAVGLAQANPDKRVLAIEWREKWVARARRRVERLGLKNLHCLRADARIALPILAPTASIERLFVLYPDPWWKKRHRHRRLLDEAFLDVVGELLVPGGLLLIKTDVLLSRERIATAAASVSTLEPLPPTDWPDERDWASSTREIQCARAGIATYRLYYRRKAP